MALVIKGSSSGQVTVDVPAAAGTNTLTLPASTANVNFVGPAFQAYASTQSIPNTTWTKVVFATEVFDTDSKFASSRFTPTVAGYYQISASTYMTSITGAAVLSIYKNGVSHKRGSSAQGTSGMGLSPHVSSLVYLDADDFVELYTFHCVGEAKDVVGGVDISYFTGTFVRS